VTPAAKGLLGGKKESYVKQKLVGSK